MPTIAHLSDPHLDGTPERRERFRRVLAQLGHLSEVDALVLSGDLTDRGTPEQYAEGLGLLPPGLPTVVVPGNHDRREAMRAALAPGSGGPLDSVLDLPGGPGRQALRIVGLDALVEGEIGGRLSPASLAFARQHVAEAPGQVLVVLHQPPVPIGHDLLDRHGLHDDDGAFAELITSSERIAAVLSGHVHAAVAARFAGKPLLGAPGISSTLRLGREADPVMDTGAPPAFAYHVLGNDGLLRSVFHAIRP